MANSPFTFRDSASARQWTTDLARKLEREKVAIVGVGGTGSFVLDFVSKTWVRQIHLYDGDIFLQHNAFRAPGPFTSKDLASYVPKAEFHGNRYREMHRGVQGVPSPIDATNVHLLEGYDTVFLCVDGGPIKALILDTCLETGTLVIDCGMGIHRVERDGGPLMGTIRATTCLREHQEHVQHCIDLAGGDVEGEYERNAQMAELNALNAALAVIKWKKIRGIYSDIARELDCAYVLDGNRLINRYEAFDGSSRRW